MTYFLMTGMLILVVSTFWLNSGGNFVVRKSFWSTFVVIRFMILWPVLNLTWFTGSVRGIGNGFYREQQLFWMMATAASWESLFDAAHGPLALLPYSKPPCSLPAYTSRCYSKKEPHQNVDWRKRSWLILPYISIGWLVRGLHLGGHVKLCVFNLEIIRVDPLLFPLILLVLSRDWRVKISTAPIESTQGVSGVFW